MIDQASTSRAAAIMAAYRGRWDSPTPEDLQQALAALVRIDENLATRAFTAAVTAVPHRWPTGHEITVWAERHANPDLGRKWADKIRRELQAKREKDPLR